MPQPDGPFWSRWSDAIVRLGDDFAGYFKARLDLAGLEARQTGERLAWYAIWLVLCGGAAVLGWALLVTGGAMLLGRYTALGTGWWLVIFGGVHALFGTTVAVMLARRMRRDVRGLEQTIEEFKEDARWIKEDLWPTGDSRSEQ